MNLARPSDAEELARVLERRRGRAGPLLVTGDPGPPGETAVARAAARALEDAGGELVATGSLDRVVAYRPADLVITVGAGTRLERLREILDEEGQWLPPARPGAVDALPGTVGGLLAAAPAGAFDLLYGPVRRHLLACRVASPDGTLRRWGRPVMKDVAGYALHSLQVGSRGRLGVLVESSLRTWPLPTVRESWILEPGPGEGSVASGPEGAWTSAALALGVRLATGPAGEAPIPDALVWTWRGGGVGRERLVLRLLGTPESVEARARRLREWARERRARLEAASDGDDAAGSGDSAAGDPCTPARDRSLRRVVLRLSVPPTELAALAGRIIRVLPPASGAAEAFPYSGILRCAWEREPGSPEGAEILRGVLEAGRATRAGPTVARSMPVGPARGAAPTAAVMVERGGPAEHAAVAARRDGAAAALEARVIEALGGGPRSWLADYV